MHDDLDKIDDEWNQLAASFDDETEIEFLDDDELLEFVHDTEF